MISFVMEINWQKENDTRTPGVLCLGKLDQDAFFGISKTLNVISEFWVNHMWCHYEGASNSHGQSRGLSCLA